MIKYLLPLLIFSTPSLANTTSITVTGQVVSIISIREIDNRIASTDNNFAVNRFEATCTGGCEVSESEDFYSVVGEKLNEKLFKRSFKNCKG